MNASQNQTSGEFPKSAPMKLSWLASKWCKEADFHVFLEERFPARFRVEGGSAAMTEAEAADIVRFICYVGSRAELDTDPKAAKRFDDFFRKPYSAWLTSRAGARISEAS